MVWDQAAQARGGVGDQAWGRYRLEDMRILTYRKPKTKL